MLIYVALHARVAHLHSNVMYIARYRHPSRLQGEAAYNLTNLSSVVAFLEECTATDFSSLLPSEYASHMGPELGRRLSLNSGQKTDNGRIGAAVGAVVTHHKFLDRNLDDIRVGDVPQLLAEYKLLARAFDDLSSRMACN